MFVVTKGHKTWHKIILCGRLNVTIQNVNNSYVIVYAILQHDIPVYCGKYKVQFHETFE